jgi:hypothetical protein
MTYDSTRRFAARGLTVSNKGSKIQYEHPVWGTVKEGVVSAVAYDPLQGQTLLTFEGGAKVALDDMAMISIVDKPTQGWPG